MTGVQTCALPISDPVRSPQGVASRRGDELPLGLLVALSLVAAPRRARFWAWLLFAVAVTQGVLGYTQYFTGEPIALVVIHVLGATATWAIVLFLPPSLRSRGAAPA